MHLPADCAASPPRQRIYAVVRRIPSGSVLTYGQVALRASLPNGARVVGFAMAAAPDDLPCHRVVARARAGRARISIRDSEVREIQRALLESEGVLFDTRGEISLLAFGATQGGRKPKSQSPSRILAPRDDSRSLSGKS